MQARLSLHLSKCHIVGNLVLRLNYHRLIAEVSSRARGLNFGQSLHLHPCFVNTSSQ